MHLWIDFKLFLNIWHIHAEFNRAFILININVCYSIMLHILFRLTANIFKITRIIVLLLFKLKLKILIKIGVLIETDFKI